MTNNHKQQPSSSTRLIWFQLVNFETNEPFKGTSAATVSISTSADLDEFRNAVKTKYADSHLKDIPSDALAIVEDKISFEERIDEEGKVKSLIGDCGKTEEDAVRVSIQSPTLFSLRQYHLGRYHPFSVKGSCIKYLNAIASQLSMFYCFDYRCCRSPTIEDVLIHKDGEEGKQWNFRRALNDYVQFDCNGEEFQMRKGQPLVNTKLPDIYTPEEWEKIKTFFQDICQRVDKGRVRFFPTGYRSIIIPHDLYTPEMITFLKQIGVKGSILNNPEDLKVYDEDEM